MENGLFRVSLFGFSSGHSYTLVRGTDLHTLQIIPEYRICVSGGM
ncbi:hypothetical protein CLOSTMETH_00938 [[Clostridium] methylpentosum DSM 5476]|uniref:Uncharacterized protein n=1 Tax=[Clostridium] methylpentosum DSM 5476 TaxID=537013 RepID=C0EAS4_9FIRM|nr:hypothetical protein CLOSTMETH_00938 [[Clostridium] methylpentosum DSM 5476]